MELDIAIGRSRSEKNWKAEYLTWDEFVTKLSRQRRTAETMEQYGKMSVADKGKVKDGPAFVGGFVRGGRRLKQNVESRSLITLDADHVGEDDFIFAAELVLGGCSYALYSTHSHRPKRQKYRLVAPVDRPMTPDEYGAVSRKLAEQIGLNYFDKTTFDVHRLMYFPSHSLDAEPVFNLYEGDPINVDDVLALYHDWRDPLEWPRHESATPDRQTAAKMEDPTTKAGTVGAFCRAYTISEAIETFLPDVYTHVEGNRWTYNGGSSVGGMIVYDDDLFAYSHHESDPCSGREVNAFDLVRLHKFGKLDENAHEKTNITKLPSHVAMEHFAVQQPKVKRARMAEINEDFADLDDDTEDDAWQESLELHPKTGDLLPTAKNVELILTHGEWHGTLAYDAFGNTEVIKGPLPWRQPERLGRSYEPWLAADDKRLRHWLAKTYDIGGKDMIQNAFTEVAYSHTFHPIKSYLEATPWDGVPRAESIFIDYLGAANTHYTHQVTRKMLLAAVSRLYRPGCKFDQMLVLIGPQGAGKSSLLAKLGCEWFSDSLKTFENKEAGEHLQSGWIFEISELSAMKKAAIEEVKAFLSKTEDRYRVAYDRVVSDFPRKCVFFGSTNSRGFLKDASGNRRFWPVDVHPEKAKYDHWDHLTDDVISQIWAEVLTWFRGGESLQLDTEAALAAEEEQQGHLETDPREGMIAEWLDTPLTDDMGNPTNETHNRVCAAQIWAECLGNRRGQIKPWEAKEICDIMRRIPGWEERKGKAKVPGYGVQLVFTRLP